MRNIQDLKNKKLQEFSEKYYRKTYKELGAVESVYISSLAEVWAYIEMVVPDDHSKYTIFDWNGQCKGERVIEPTIALNAKDVVSAYCWGKTWQDIRKKYNNDAKTKDFLKNNSVMHQRLENGNNLIIFGESEKKLGRTMIASIVMKEAIKLRLKTGRQKVQTYDWVDFIILREDLIKDTEKISTYRACDWLVVDNITHNVFATEKQRMYITEIITPFFLDRFNNKLPTMLIFRFDIRKESFNIEEDMGLGMSYIVNSNKTFKIPLSKQYKI